MTLDRLALGSLVLLGATIGLGDLGQASLVSVALRSIVRGLLPLALALTLVAFVVAWLRRQPWPAAFPPRQVSLALLLWLLVLLVSAVMAPSHQAATLAALSRPLSGVLLLWSVTLLATTPARWMAIARGLAVGGMLVAMVGLAEASGSSVVLSVLSGLHDGPVPLGDVPRIASTLSHPNVAAIVLELTLPFVGAWAVTTRGWLRAVMALAAGGVLLALVQTFSRAGVVAACLGLSLMFALGGSRRMVVPLGLTLGTVAAALAWAAVADPGLDRRLSAGLDEASTIQPARPVFWSVALRMYADHPWLGVGLDNFRWQFADYSGIAADNLGIHAHNQYLELLADTGLLGLLLWLAVLGALAASAARTATTDWPWRAAPLASLATWLIHALLDDFERFWPATVGFWLVCGLSLGMVRREGVQRAQQTIRRIPFTHEPASAGPQRLGPVFGSATESQQLTAGQRKAQGR
jgi:putative inorganic carbon (HCO3(-)) transporter